MASTSTISMTLPVTKIAQRNPRNDAFFQPLRVSSIPSRLQSNNAVVRLEVKASAAMKEKLVTGLTAAAVAAALVIPDIAEAAQPGVSPSLKNFLLSIVSGGVVVGVLIGAVVGVSNFDPVKRSSN